MSDDQNIFSLTDDHVIPEDHLFDVCKYRQGEQCCKYIVYFEQGRNFYCVKDIEDLRVKIDAQQMIAQGDNCIGMPHEKRKNCQRTPE